MAEETQERQTGKQGAFAIMIDHPRNCDVVLQCIPGSRLRSIIKSNRTTKDAKSGQVRVPKDQARHLGELGDVPGHEIHVNPTRGTYTIHDGATDEDLKRVRRYMSETSGIRNLDEFKATPDQNGRLDPNRMKTLCRELYWLVKAGEARVIKGTLDGKETETDIGDDYMRISTEPIDRLPGRYLLNPGSTIPNTQPKFEDSFAGYRDQLNQTS